MRAVINSLLITHYSSNEIAHAKIFLQKLAPPRSSQHDLGVLFHFYEIWFKNFFLGSGCCNSYFFFIYCYSSFYFHSL